MDKQANFVVDEENFYQAVNNASYWARQRLFKKMGKTKFRAAEYNVKAGHVVRTPLPPADLEQYVTNFVAVNYSKGKR